MIFYTCYNGGVWQPQAIRSSRQKIIKRLNRQHPSKYFVNLTTHIVHSVLFKNGHRWDTIHRNTKKPIALADRCWYRRNKKDLRNVFREL